MPAAADHYEQLREELRFRRKELHLTQEQLAEALSTSTTHISRVERGQAVPGRDLLIRWCLTLHVSLDQTVLLDSGLEPKTIDLLRRIERLDYRRQERLFRMIELYLRE